MIEHHIEVKRTARYSMLGEPGPGTTEVWIVCHGFAQLASRFLRRFTALEGANRLIVAPEALNRFYLENVAGPHGSDARVGATWMTREDRESEIADYVAYLDTLHDRIFNTVPRAHVKIVVLGFSQGVATVSRWVSFGNVRPDHLVLWAATTPPDLDLAAVADRWRRLRLTFVVGSEEKAAHPRVVEKQAELLREFGIEHDWREFTGGHHLDEGVLLDLARDGRAGE